MTSNGYVFAVFGGLLAVITVATAVGYWLERRDGDSNPVIENLNARIRSWWVILACLGGAFLFGKTGVILLFALSSFAALREFYTVATTRSGDHYALEAGFYVFLPAQYYLVYIEWYGLAAILIPVYAFLLLPVFAALRGDTAKFLERISEVQWGLMICVYCLSHVPSLLTLKIPGYEGEGLLLVAFLLLVVQMSDVLQYVWGKLCGKHKVAPKLSPSKTWEGLVGGVLSASLVGALLFFITPFTFLQAAGQAFLICLMGFFGGLVMSAIKRDRGVKDWGTAIEGHGGFLDRLDSVVFAAPVFFHVTRYFWSTV